MDYKCLVVDDDLTIAENTAEYFNIFDIKTAFVTSYEDAVKFLGRKTKLRLFFSISILVTDPDLNCARKSDRNLICRSFLSVRGRVMTIYSRL